MAVRIGAREARNNFSHLVGRVHYGEEVMIIERSWFRMIMSLNPMLLITDKLSLKISVPGSTPSRS